jgi:predicted nucleic acid-binding protein
MIIFDASYLVVYLNQDPEPAKDRQGNPVSRFKERVEYLASSLNASGEQIGIPTPAMAEVLVRAGNRAQFVSILSDRMRFQLLPFDARGAIEAAELIALIRSKRETWGTHAKVKFDIQIVATAKAEDASAIYSDDQDIENFAKRLKIPVMRICDLPLPPPKEFPKIDTGAIGAQSVLFDMAPPLIQATQEAEPAQSTELEVNNEVQPAIQQASAPIRKIILEEDAEIASTHPPPIGGGNEGHTEGEAVGEAAVPPTPAKASEKPKTANQGGLGESDS